MFPHVFSAQFWCEFAGKMFNFTSSPISPLIYALCLMFHCFAVQLLCLFRFIELLSHCFCFVFTWFGSHNFLISVVVTADSNQMSSVHCHRISDAINTYDVSFDHQKQQKLHFNFIVLFSIFVQCGVVGGGGGGYNLLVILLMSS